MNSWIIYCYKTDIKRQSICGIPLAQRLAIWGAPGYFDFFLLRWNNTFIYIFNVMEIISKRKKNITVHMKIVYFTFFSYSIKSLFEFIIVFFSIAVHVAKSHAHFPNVESIKAFQFSSSAPSTGLSVLWKWWLKANIDGQCNGSSSASSASCGQCTVVTMWSHWPLTSHGCPRRPPGSPRRVGRGKERGEIPESVLSAGRKERAEGRRWR